MSSNNESETPGINSAAANTHPHADSAKDTTPYRVEGGREFHTDESVPYLLPSDSEENDRVHRQHWLIRLAFGSHFDAPVQESLEEGINVLDSGCGPATWTLEISKSYPNSHFIGTDISPRFPEAIKPANCEFKIHNITHSPPFPENYFGYIHQRLLTLGLPAKDWPQVLKYHFETLKPGGWIELTEVSYESLLDHAGPNLTIAYETSKLVMGAAGLDTDLANHLAPLLKDAGFINVQTRAFEMPFNHGGKIGELFWQDYTEVLHAGKSHWVKIHPQFEVPGAFEQYIEEMNKECQENKSTVVWTRAFAQKPLTADEAAPEQASE
ncbi:S-adenosyl-L-methionine-dependent methyltransferase [Dichotomocladium elegans]|nr:S-adenosyl-L-methionine-dependent methyltransferase [Dichotomocladium elegans]